jgi:hypothetical protein
MRVEIKIIPYETKGELLGLTFSAALALGQSMTKVFKGIPLIEKPPFRQGNEKGARHR